MNVRDKEDLHGQKTLFQIGKLRTRRERGYGFTSTSVLLEKKTCIAGQAIFVNFFRGQVTLQRLLSYNK